MRKFIPLIFLFLFLIIPLNGVYAEEKLVTCIVHGPDGNLSVPNQTEQACIDLQKGSGFKTDTVTNEQPGWWTEQVFKPVIAWIFSIILQLASLLTALGGKVLNGAVYHTIVNMAKNYGDIGAIDSTWRTIRDLANMSFIFMLVYAAIETILGIGKDTKNLIVRVVVVAILMNFSLFFTGVVIDTANLLTLTFYEAIVPGAANQGLSGIGLSEAFMSHLNLQNIYQATGSTGLGMNQIVTMGVMGTVTLLIAAFVFFAVALMFIIRYVVLIVVLILSPIAMISFVLPKMETYRNQWKDALINQSFFAPIYMALTWITLRVLTDVTKVFKGENYSVVETISVGASGVLNDPHNFFSTFINFAVVIAFLIISLVIAKEWSSKTAGGVGKLTSWATGVAGGATIGLAARAGRLGAGIYAMDPRSDKYKRLEAESAKKGIGGTMARLRLSTADKARTSSFDMRGSRLGSVLSGAGLDMGQAGGKGGYEADRTAVREFFEQPGTEAYKKRQERARRAGGELDIKDNLEDAKEYDRLVALDAVATAGGPALSVADSTKLAALRTPDPTTGKTTVETFETAINKATTKEIEAIIESNRKLLDTQAFANRISVQQLEAINKSDKFSETDKETLKKARFSQLDSIDDSAGLAALARKATGATLTATEVEAADKVEKARKLAKGLTDSELEMVNPALLGNDEFIGQLKQGQIDTLVKSSRFTTSTKDKVREIRRKPLLDYIDTGNVAKVESTIKKTDHKVLAGYMGITGRRGVKIAMEPEVIRAYTPSILKKMANEMNVDDIQTLRDAIISVRDPAVKAVMNTVIRAGGTTAQATTIAGAAGRVSRDDVVKWLFDVGNGKGLDVFN